MKPLQIQCDNLSYVETSSASKQRCVIDFSQQWGI